MKNYVVAFLSFFDNEIILEKIQANNEVDAIKMHSQLKDWEFQDNATLEDISDMLFNCDAVVSVIEV